MSRPSEPLLQWLRQLMAERKLNVAQLAEKTKLDRNHLRKAVAGSEPMTLDDLQLITTALELRPADLGLSGVEVAPEAPTPEAPPAEAPARPVALGPAPVGEEEPPAPRVDAYGNQPRQLFEVGFQLGCDFLFLADVKGLDTKSGLPLFVLQDYGKRQNPLLPIKLDAAYHSYNEPRYDEGGITLKLSFDALYDCRFPWATIKQVIFFPAPFEPEPEEPEEEEPKPPPGRPRLRLVE